MALYDKASLVLIPSGTKEGVVFSQKPTNGDGDFTFSRSTAATRVNADGLIEKETQNLLLQSNTFDTTWATTGTITSGQSGYDGSSDAWLFTNSCSTCPLLQSVSTSGVQTFSAYFKKNASYGVRIYIVGTTNRWAFFNLSNGTITSESGLIDANVEAIGTDWYRCSVTYNDTLTDIRLYVSDNATSQVLGNITIQDAQLNQGLVADSYLETTTAVYGGITDNIPRLDYTDSSCPALLLEGQRTNVITQSEFFDSSAWTTLSDGETIVNNSVISPDGKLNASTLEGDGSSSSIYIRQDVTLTTSVDYTFSIFAKKGTNDFLAVSAEGFSGATNTLVIFDLNNSVVTTGVGNIDDYGNGWLRCIYTISISADGVGRFLVYPAYDGTTRAFPTSSDANGQNIYIYGAQVEEGSYPTSYIPTYGTSVTFESDSAINQANSNLPTEYPFTLFAEFKVTPASEGQALTLSNTASGTEYFSIDFRAGFYRIVSRPSTTLVTVTSTLATTIGLHKICGVFTSTTLKLFVDGTLVGSGANTQAFNASINDIFIGQLRSVSDTGNRNPVKQALVFKSALTDEEAIALTTI